MLVHKRHLDTQSIAHLTKQVNKKLIVISATMKDGKKRTILLEENVDHVHTNPQTMKITVSNTTGNHEVLDLLNVKKFNVDMYEYEDGTVYRTKDFVPGFGE